MNQIVKTGLYEEDLHGNNPDNLVTDELHTLQVPGIDDYYFIIPRAAPFFVSSLRVFDRQTGREYIEDVDYTIGHRFIEAMDSIGRPIAGSIRIMRRDITGTLKITYRTIGGNWGYNDKQILDELARKQYNPIVRVWGNIGPLPYSFPPLIHDQSLDTLVGSEDLNNSLVRIGDILEATASGTTESHMNDFNNPHRVNKTQVGLGNVDNFKTATIQQTIAGTAANLFVTPKGLYEALLVRVISPLTDHINATGNVHGLHKRDIDLGNVQNYPVATNAQAVDVTNNQTYMTPYTTYLMMRDLQGSGDVDQILIDLNEHLNARNPHGITPSMINAYTKDEVDQLLRDAAAGALDEFGGMSPDDWKNTFPLDDDFMGLMENISESEELLINMIAKLPNIPNAGDRDPKIVSGLSIAFNGYAVNNSEGDLFGLSQHGNYYLKDNLYKLKAFASTPKTTYVTYSNSNSLEAFGDQGVFNGFTKPALIEGIWAGDNALFISEGGDPKLTYHTRSAKNITVFPAKHTNTIVEIIVHSGIGTTDVLAIVRYQTAGSTTIIDLPVGAASWVTAFNNLKNSYSGKEISVAILTNHISLVVNGSSAPEYYLYRINFGANITLTNVTNSFRAVRRDGTVVTLPSLTSSLKSLDHNGNHNAVILSFSEEYSVAGDILTRDEWAYIDIATPTTPTWPLPNNLFTQYDTIMTGNDYFITLDKKDNVCFWGHSANNYLRFPAIKRL